MGSQAGKTPGVREHPEKWELKMITKYSVSRRFWRGLEIALVPALALWWVILYVIAKIIQ